MKEDHLAPHSKRLLAAIIDILFLVPLITAGVLLTNYLFSIPVTPAFSLYGFEVEMNPWAQEHFWELVGIYTLVKLLVVAPYFILLEASRWKGSPGKRLMQLEVVGYAGGRISLTQSVARFFSKILSAQLLIGYIMILFMARRQGLHDILAKTLVVKRSQGTAP